MSKIYTPVKNSIDYYRDEAIAIAEDLGYTTDTIQKIEQAMTEVEISNILATARNSNK